MEQETTHAASVPGGTPEPHDELRAEDNGGTTPERPGFAGRRLFSLTSQLRRPKPQSQTQAWVQAQAEAEAGRETARSNGSGAAPGTANGHGEATAEHARAEHAAAETGAAPTDGVTPFGPQAAAEQLAEAPATEALEVGPRRIPAASAPAPRRPARPIYTLQQVHEMTGIPYPKLAFYAASEASRIPSLGERHAPAYPFESLQAFCRLHAERTPGWEVPDLTPPDDEISLRLEALERGQQQLEAVLQAVLAELAEPLTGTSV